MKKENLYRVLVFFAFFIFLLLGFTNEVNADSILPNDPIQYPKLGRRQNSKDGQPWSAILDSNSGKSIIPGVEDSSYIVPYDYSFSPILTKDTKYYLINLTTGDETLQRTSGVSSALSNIRTKTTIRVTDVGHFNKKRVDMLYTVLDDTKGYTRDKNGRYGSLKIDRLDLPTIDSNTSRRDKALAQNRFLYTQWSGDLNNYPILTNTIQYIYHDENTNVNQHKTVTNLKGIMNNGRFSRNKAFYLDPNYYMGGRSSIASGNNKNLYTNETYKNGVGSVWISSSRGTATGNGIDNDTDNRFTELYSSSNGKLKLTFYRCYDIIRYSVQPQTVSPISLPPISVEGTTNENTDNNNLITWNVRQNFPPQPQGTLLDNYSYSFNIPKKSNIDLSQTRVIDSSGKDLSSNFNISYDSENSIVNVVANNNANLVNGDIQFVFNGKLDPADSDTLSYLNSDDYVVMNGEVTNVKYGIMGYNYTTDGDSDSAKTHINSYPSVPKLDKSVKNTTSKDSKNRVNDNLSYTVVATNASNNKFDSKWGNVIITDNIPIGLDIDLSSLKLDNNKLDESNYSYDSNKRVLTVNTNASLTNNKSKTLTYDAKINSDASGKLITNNATASGEDVNILKPTNVTAKSSSSIQVENNIFDSTFTKKIKNLSNLESDFKSSTQGKYGDTIDYQISFQVNNDSKNFPGGFLSDKLNEGLYIPSNDGVVMTVKKDGISTTSQLNSTHKIELPTLSSGDSVNIEYQAIIKQNTPNVIHNTANIDYDDSDTKLPQKIQASAELDPEDWIGFLAVPTSINFGNHNAYDMQDIENESTLINKSNKQTLTVMNYTKSHKYNISVQYNNLGTDAMRNENNKKLNPDTNGYLIYLNQAQDDLSKRYVPISEGGTYLNTLGFDKSGYNDLTDYVGKGMWKLKTDGSPVESGRYIGRITWELDDSI